MRTQQRIWCVAALCACGVALAEALPPLAVRAPYHPVKLAAFDIHTPAPFSPCGESFAAGSQVTFTWSTISGATSYVITIYNQGSGGSVQLPPTSNTSMTLTQEVPGMFSWDVYSTGWLWFASDKSLRCYFTIQNP